MKLGFIKSAAAVAALLGASAWASAATYTFVNITNNNSVNLSGQLSVDVTDPGGGFVDFTFRNNVGIGSSITAVYFDDGTLLGISSISNSAGVAFDDPATPSDLPGGNSVGFVTTAMFSADANAPVSPNGVNTAAEWVKITFELLAGKTYADTLAALDSGSGLRIGVRVQSIEGGGQNDSDGYVNTVPVIPLPAAAWMGMALMGSVGGYGIIRKRRQEA